MNEEGILQVDVLGVSFALRTDESSQYLDLLYNHYKIMLKQVQNVASSTNPLETAIIAGIMIADELYKEKAKSPDADNTADFNEMESLTLKMISSIDEVV